MPALPTANTLEALERRIAELEAELRLIGGTIQYLERTLGDCTHRQLDRTDEERRDREREEHVRDELFNYDLSHSPEDE